MNVDSTDEPRFAAYVAIDWGDSKHVWSLQPADADHAALFFCTAPR